MEGPRPRGRSKRTWTEVVEQEGCYRSLLMDEVDKGWLVIRMGVSG